MLKARRTPTFRSVLTTASKRRMALAVSAAAPFQLAHAAASGRLSMARAPRRITSSVSFASCGADRHVLKARRTPTFRSILTAVSTERLASVLPSIASSAADLHVSNARRTLRFRSVLIAASIGRLASAVWAVSCSQLLPTARRIAASAFLASSAAVAMAASASSASSVADAHAASASGPLTCRPWCAIDFAAAISCCPTPVSGCGGCCCRLHTGDIAR